MLFLLILDYTYLEDVARQTDNFTRERVNTVKELKNRGAQARAKILYTVANELGIRYSALPMGMSRNKLNQSNYSKKFPNNKPFYAFFENLLLSEKPFGKSAYGIIRHQLREFVDAGIEQFMIALKKEKAPRGHFVNVTDMLHLTFKDVLKGEQIIEYPIFYIWLKQEEQPSDILVLEDKKVLITEIQPKEEEQKETSTVDNREKEKEQEEMTAVDNQEKEEVMKTEDIITVIHDNSSITE
ncbi:uncharacterized protein BX663DRAFT_428499 [Cokeromyces recurvatus]|uniref:uncharacterized protein n=1 Tax=Cokeromyces recurvatus TaxID=90255 RepID=UPI00221F9413|nr:uncharacterized protein BX663DRAFT_428499 [Cokeromyces recurvatus]KAI7906020.1 hypothetical protein BX663DRAFT_428499 [Cokeromyces recurvatus]